MFGSYIPGTLTFSSIHSYTDVCPVLKTSGHTGAGVCEILSEGGSYSVFFKTPPLYSATVITFKLFLSQHV